MNKKATAGAKNGDWLGHQAFYRLKDLLLTNQLDFRQKFSEKQIVDQLGLGRTPIREALIMLEMEGLVERDSFRGFRIRRFSVKDIEDIYEFRFIIEQAICDSIGSKVNPAGIKRLEQCLRESKTLINGGDATQSIVKGLGFHLQLAELSGNHALIKAYRNISDQLTLIGWSFQEVESSIESLTEHHTILKTLKSKKIDEFKEMLGEHCRKAKSRVIGIVKSDTERLYFSP